MTLGVPVKVLHEAEGHTVTVESATGELYRGVLIEAEDNMNMQLRDVSATYRDGRSAHLSNIFIRGSQVRFAILPDMLKNAPMLNVDKKSKQPRGLGRGAFRGIGRGRGMMPGGGRGGGGGGPPHHRGGGRGGPRGRAFHGTPGFMRNSERARYGGPDSRNFR
ncbi:Oidioi.mRNA.OKI2018_I69.chr1.g1931.t1.cds [Oikopleura dioica]|uniref:Small nuclear ribonucleoprotein Sm D3 n=1 Tax=Oikopleura dioica TaxID=34765 RepID=A0ABN7SPH4_OIKDI|nr:Oidioi.mRNA.OKI2018_I69.chr1.g1931.t1.cds [Oikopleura dioica]